MYCDTRYCAVPYVYAGASIRGGDASRATHIDSLRTGVSKGFRVTQKRGEKGRSHADENVYGDLVGQLEAFAKTVDLYEDVGARRAHIGGRAWHDTRCA